MKKLFKILPIYILVFLFAFKVDAFAGKTTISESPTSTEKGNYITLKHTVDTAAGEMSIEYTYDNKYLQLVGFEPTNAGSCTLEKNTISCSSVQANVAFVYPVFKIVSTLDGNKDISATFNTTEAHNTTKTTITKTDKIIAVTEIRLDSNSENLIVGGTYQIVTTVLPENATNKTVTYTSSNDAVATVQNGLVKAEGVGIATITVSSGTVKNIFTVTVSEEEIPLEDIKTEEEITLKEGETKEIELTFEPETTTVDISKVNYSSSDSKVAIVDADGKIVALKEGTATITISIDDITTITKVTVEKSEEEKTAEKPKEKSNTGSIFLAVIITFVVTLILVFIVNSLKRRKEVNNIDEDNDFKMNKYM